MSLRTFPIGTGPYRFVRYDADDTLVLSAFEGYWDGLPNNAGIVMKVVPDDTMRGLELRKGTTDLVVNDLPPDIVHQLEKSGEFSIERSPGLDFFYLGFNMRDPVLADNRVRQAIGYATNRDAIIEYLRRGLARPAAGLVPIWRGPSSRTSFASPTTRAPDGCWTRPAIATRMATGPRSRLTAVAEDLDERGNAPAGHRDSARSGQVGIDLDVRSYEFATFYDDVVKGNFQMFALQWVGGAMVDPGHAAAGLPFAAKSRRRVQSRPLPEPASRPSHRSGDDVARRERLESAITARRRSSSPTTRRTFRSGARPTSIVAQKGLEGLHLNPVGDFNALRDVKRMAPPPSSAGSGVR